MSPSEYKKREAALKVVFRRYVFGAKKRKLNFELSYDDFKYLITKNCVYCDAEPQSKLINKTNVNIHGIDRFENELGYLASNCYTCCQTCNQMKSDYSFDEFKEHIINIHNKLVMRFI